MQGLHDLHSRVTRPEEWKHHSAGSDHARRQYVFLEVLDQDIEMVPDVREHIAQSFLSCHLSALFMLPFLLDPSRALAGVRRRPLHLAVLFGGDKAPYEPHVGLQG